MPDMRRVVVIGLDGVPLPFLEMLADRGIMPRIRELIRRGTHGQLESVFPPVTAPAWVSFATGKTPDNHGCFDFVVPDGSLSRLRVITTRDIRSQTLYEIAEAAGRDCILINLPVSSPPRLRKGITVGDFLTMGPDWLFPPTLREEIPQFANYRLVADAKILGQGRLEDHIRDIADLERVRFECSRELFRRKPWDLFFALFSGCDWVQHIAFQELSTGQFHRCKEAVQLFRDLDEYVGWFLDHLPPATTLLVVSDHGFAVYEGRFCVNTWLRNQGYLATTDRPTVERPRFAFIEEVKAVRAKRVRLRLPDALYTWMGRHGRLLALANAVHKRIILRYLPIEVRPRAEEVDIARTAAYTTTSEAHGIHLNDRSRFADGLLTPREAQEIREKIMVGLRELRDPAGGRVVTPRRREEVFRGPWASLGPDILLFQENYSVFGPIFPMALASKATNDHASHGIILAYDSDIRAGAEVNGQLIDLAPTILHLLGLPVPSDMDGRILRELFDPSSTLRRGGDSPILESCPPTSEPMDQGAYGQAEEEVVKERLRNLGYLD